MYSIKNMCLPESKKAFYSIDHYVVENIHLGKQH